MSTRQLPSSLLDYKPPTAVDTPAVVYADSATGTGNGRSTSCSDDVRELQKYYWEQAGAESGAPDAEDAVQHRQVPTDQLPPELRHDNYSVATGSARLPPKLIPYGLPVCGDPTAAKLLTNVAANSASEYYETSPPVASFLPHNDYVSYGYSAAQDMASMMVGNSAYHHQAAPGYPCQRMTPASSPAQFADVKSGLLTHGNTAELYQWVREQQNFAAANAIGTRTLRLFLFSFLSYFLFYVCIMYTYSNAGHPSVFLYAPIRGSQIL